MVSSFFPLFLQGKLCRAGAGAVHGGQTGFQQPAGSPPRGLLVDMEEVAGSGYGDTSLFFSFTLPALKCVVHAFRRGSHFCGWGLCLFSCTFFFVVVWLLRLPTPLPLITYAFLSLSTHDICTRVSFVSRRGTAFFPPLFKRSRSSAPLNRAHRWHVRACIICKSGASSADRICAR